MEGKQQTIFEVLEVQGIQLFLKKPKEFKQGQAKPFDSQYSNLKPGAKIDYCYKSGDNSVIAVVKLTNDILTIKELQKPEDLALLQSQF
jgi:hypothetical protein